MKLQVRKGVFETNSSSTHSLSIDSKSLDDVLQHIHKEISERYKNSIANNPYFEEEQYIKDDTLLVEGISFEDGDEAACIYYVIKNPIAKLQYIGSLLYYNNYYIEDFNKELYSSYPLETFLNTKSYKEFKKLALKYLKENGYENIKKLNFDIEYTAYVENTLVNNVKENILFTEEHKITPKTVKNMFNIIMDKNNIITYADEAYTPFQLPNIYII